MQIIEEALTFDDVSLVPARSEVLPREVDLQTRLVRDIHLNVPILSAAMDTVTEGRMAIAVAQSGGLGVVHKNLSVRAQAEQVRLVKKYESGVIRDPFTVTPQTPVGEALQLTRSHNISGLPVVGEDGCLAGIVTNRDLRFEERFGEPVSTVMTPRERLLTVCEGEQPGTVVELMRRHRIEKVPVVDAEFRLRGLITVKDLDKASRFPHACKDRQERLRVGAAVSAGGDRAERCAALAEAEVDVLVVDSAHGHAAGVLEGVRRIRREHPEMALIAGNVAEAEGALALAEAGADAVKVGVGPGSICTTRVVTGVGVPQVTAVARVAAALHGSDLPIIADGGIRFSGDLAKALAAGAHTVMIGGLLAGTEEAPGDLELYQGRAYKSYRGMGSLGAMSSGQGAGERYFQEGTAVDKLVPEGIEGRVPFRGPATQVLQQLLGGLRSAMGYLGCRDLATLRAAARFVRITAAGVREGHVHDVTITKEPPNYQVD